MHYVFNPITNQHIFRQSISIAEPGVVASDLVANAIADIGNLNIQVYDANYLGTPRFPLEIVPEHPNPKIDLHPVIVVRRFNRHFDGVHLPNSKSESPSKSSSSSTSCSPQSSQSSANTKDSSHNDEDDLFDGTEWDETQLE